VILDLEAPGSTRPQPRLGWTLSVASAAVAAAALLVINGLPHDQVARLLAPSGPSLIAQALAQPRPQILSLELPADLAMEIPPLRVDGVYGPARPDPTVRTFRIRGTSDMVFVAVLPDAQPVYRPAHVPGEVLAVHGSYAAASSDPSVSLSWVRWTEHGVTYQVSSKTLAPVELARIAEQVR
jgi:hypothetical protein